MPCKYLQAKASSTKGLYTITSPIFGTYFTSYTGFWLSIIRVLVYTLVFDPKHLLIAVHKNIQKWLLL